MTEKDKVEWDELYKYVKNLLKYDDAQALPSYIILRLKGLTQAKFIANNKIKSNAQYPFKIILLTFKYCNNEINRALSQKSFKDENHKLNYILKIVEHNINNVYLKYKKNESIKKEIANIDIDNTQKTEYTRKTQELKNNDLKKFW